MQWLVSAAYAAALFNGQYEGAGTVCHGKLSVAADTVAWNSAGADCGATPFTVIEHRPGSATEPPSIVFELAKNDRCAFRVIRLEAADSAAVQWTATGYLSLADFKNPQLAPHEKLACAVRKTGKL